MAALGGGGVGVVGYQAFFDPPKPGDVQKQVIALQQQVRELESRLVQRRQEDLMREIIRLLDKRDCEPMT